MQESGDYFEFPRVMSTDMPINRELDESPLMKPSAEEKGYKSSDLKLESKFYLHNIEKSHQNNTSMPQLKSSTLTPKNVRGHPITKNVSNRAMKGNGGLNSAEGGSGTTGSGGVKTDEI